MSIGTQLETLRKNLPESVTLVAVSKTKPLADIKQAYQAGQRIFGENKVQEMTKKWEALPKDIQWHMIGHIQTNKIKYMAPYVALIHGVDRIKVLAEIDKQAKKNHRVIDCLLQVHIAEEDTKFGFSPEELIALATTDIKAHYPNLNIKGLMGMASNTTNTKKVTKEFKTLKVLYEQCNTNGLGFNILSMGMSADYPLAVLQGSTMIRVGSKIFGHRNY